MKGYLRHLALKLPKRKSGPGYQFEEEIELDYYRLQKISEGLISLGDGVAKPLDGPREVGTGIVRDEDVALSSLIDIINERFGSELTEADQLFFDQLAEAATMDDALRQAAEANYISNPEMQDVVSKWLGEKVYNRFADSPDATEQSPQT